MNVHELFVYLCVPDASKAVDFYARAFGAVELFRLAEPSGRVGHAEIKIGSHVVMLSEAFPEIGVSPPVEGAGSHSCIHLHVDDADAVLRKAAEAGGTIVREAQDEFYGERSGRLRDPAGHEWLVGHSIEKVEPEEMQRRYTAQFEG